MKNMQLVEEEARWKRLCLQELGAGAGAGGIKKLKRKSSKAPAKLPGGRSLQAEDLLPPAPQQPPVLRGKEGPAAGAPGGLEGRGGGGGGEVMPGLRKRAFPAGLLAAAPQQPLRKDTCHRSASGNGAESLQARIMGCQQQQQQQQQRPLESPYSPVSHVIYNSSSSSSSSSSNPDSCPSPRKRLAEPAGVSSEIKALQQTRRLLANARERSRVHTISAAFEALRKQVPCYSYGQKLSKLAILRIACNYILSLARLADLDYSADHSNMSFSECVEQCSRTLQAEGRSKKRKGFLQSNGAILRSDHRRE